MSTSTSTSTSPRTALLSKGLLGIFFGFLIYNLLPSASLPNATLFRQRTQEALAFLNLGPSPALIGALQLVNATAESVFPVPWNTTRGLQHRNQETFRHLLECSLLNTCTEKDNRVVLLDSLHFTRIGTHELDNVSHFSDGELIWAEALMWALDQLGYPYLILYAREDPHNSPANEFTGKVYGMLQGQVSMVIGDYLSVPDCLKNPWCVKSEENPTGVPPEKLFVFDGFGEDVGHPLGREWHLTFYPLTHLSFTYLGLTIEPYCSLLPVVPPSDRLERVYLLAKHRSVFYPPAPNVLSDSAYERITQETGMNFTMGSIELHLGYEGEPDRELEGIPPGIEDLGTANRDGFLERLGNYKAVLGIGWSTQPSSPLEGLCLGTPFINLVWEGLRSEPDRLKWQSQHPYLTRFDPPYVYHYENEEDLLEAVKAIQANPLTERFVPDDMKADVYLQRVEELVTRDWEGFARNRTSAGLA